MTIAALISQCDTEVSAARTILRDRVDGEPLSIVAAKALLTKLRNATAAAQEIERLTAGVERPKVG